MDKPAVKNRPSCWMAHRHLMHRWLHDCIRDYQPAAAKCQGDIRNDASLANARAKIFGPVHPARGRTRNGDSERLDSAKDMI